MTGTATWRSGTKTPGRREVPRPEEADAPLAGAADSLTTGGAASVEAACGGGDFYVDQPCALYSDADHLTWRTLYRRMSPLWEKYAATGFRDGLRGLPLGGYRIPQLSVVNGWLEPRSGFRARPVSGYVPAFVFFDCLARREFPTTVTIRRPDSLDYLPEPDIFHDLAGHVPLHTNRGFADGLARLGDCARQVAERSGGRGGDEREMARLTSVIRGMARFFWFTVEFGLLSESGDLRAYGSGLLSSCGELAHAIEGQAVQRYPFQLEWVINQGFEIHHYQPLLFVIESLDQLYDLVDELDRWIREGRLDFTAPGEPAVSPADLRSFVESTAPWISSGEILHKQPHTANGVLKTEV